ncbi:MAG: hypothetical protein AB1649_23175 [Chloroflexota bacterium]
MQRKKYTIVLMAFGLLGLMSFACQMTGSPLQSNPPITQVIAVTQIVPVTQVVTVTEMPPVAVDVPLKPEIILLRLDVSFLGQDGHKVIGTGCPGTDNKGTVVDYHFIVSNVDEDKDVERIIVAGDNSTLTWESPCSKDWALLAKNLGNGNWEIFIAPSEPARIYTVIFFYDDSSFALGMDTTP